MSVVTRSRWLALVAGCAFSAALAVHAAADEIVVMTSGAFSAAYQTLSVRYGQMSGDRFSTVATAMGVGATSIPSRLAAGERVDLVIVASDALDRLIQDGRIAKDSRIDLAQSRIAMAVRKGAPKPDISSVASLKRTLLAAKSVAYSASVSGTYLVQELFPRLGIADEMRQKSRRIDAEPVGAVVARGDAEIGFQQVSELRAEPGVDIVGPLPGDTQRVTVFSAGIPTTSPHPAAARAFLKFLYSPAARQTIADAGLEPLPVQGRD